MIHDPDVEIEVSVEVHAVPLGPNPSSLYCSFGHFYAILQSALHAGHTAWNCKLTTESLQCCNFQNHIQLSETVIQISVSV